MKPIQVPDRAEKAFKQREREREGQLAMAEYEAAARATREKTARLRALRLARDAKAEKVSPPRAEKKTRARRKAAQ